MGSGARTSITARTCRWRIEAVAAAPCFQLSGKAARDIVARQIGATRDGWDDVCEEAALTELERNLFGRRIFLKDFIFEGSAREEFSRL